MKKTIILITGKHYSGKGYVCNLFRSYLDKLSISHHTDSAREIIGEFIKDIQNSPLGSKYPLEENSHTIRAVGQLMTITKEKESGLPLITARKIAKIKANQKDVSIVDSIWHPHLVSNWKNLSPEFNVIILAITASDEERYQGFLERDSSSEPIEKTPEFFHARDAQEDQPNMALAPCVTKCIEMADITIVNSRKVDMVSIVEKELSSIF